MPAVLPGRDLRALIEEQERDVKNALTKLGVSRLEFGCDTGPTHGQPQNTRRFLRRRRHSALTELLSVEHESRCVDAFTFPTLGIRLLPRSRFLACKRVPPSEAVPVIHMKSDRYEILPETRFGFQPG